MPRQIKSLAPAVSPAAALKPPNYQDDDGMFGTGGTGGVRIVAAAAGSSHTVLVTAQGRICIFGEGAAVCGGDVSVLETGVDGVDMGLTAGGGLVHGSREEGGLDPLLVSGEFWVNPSVTCISRDMDDLKQSFSLRAHA